jgi:hypothetical protein
MTEWELFDVLHGAMSMALGSFTAYLTIVFGFLVASYFAAGRLTRVEILILSSLFTFGAFVMSYSGVAHLIRHYFIAEKLSPLMPEIIWFNSVSLIVITGIVMFSGIVASLYFLYDRRKRISADQASNSV